MSAQKAPIVAIVGRANVGKSSFFNAVLGRREAIVANEAGTTRDALYAKANAYGKDFWLVDTAGMKDAEDDFELTIQEQITEATTSADIILVMVEANIPITEEDRRVAKMALKSKKEVLLLVNKSDLAGALEQDHFAKLGIKEMYRISAAQQRGLDSFLATLANKLPKASIHQSANRVRIALLGRPNVGKSSLFNTLAKKQQAIVADKAGTTRDVNRTIIKFNNKELELMDTAGIRRSGKIEQGVERFSVLRSLRAIEEADVCFLLIDANEIAVQLDQKIAGMIKEAGKGLVLVVAKWDSVDKDAYTRDSMAPRIQHAFDFVPWAPLVFTSSISGQNVTKLFELTLEIMQERARRLTTAELNRWLKKVVDSHPPAGLKNRHVKLNYMVQETDNPIPSFKVFGAHTKFIHWSYRRYMERAFREAYGFSGTPVQFWFIEKH